MHPNRESANGTLCCAVLLRARIRYRCIIITTIILPLFRIRIMRTCIRITKSPIIIIIHITIMRIIMSYIIGKRGGDSIDRSKV